MGVVFVYVEQQQPWSEEESRQFFGRIEDNLLEASHREMDGWRPLDGVHAENLTARCLVWLSRVVAVDGKP